CPLMAGATGIARARRPILPEAGAGGPALLAVIAVISFLASLALAGFLLVSTASDRWTRELQAALTVQVTGDTAEAIADRTRVAVRVLENTEGINAVAVMPADDARALLSPWLGEAAVDTYFAVPAIIEVEASPALSGSVDQLRARMAAAVPGVLINDHGTWKARLGASVRSIQVLAFAVFALVMMAACAIAMFAARVGLAANHDVVSLLHLVGASDQFIAGQVQRRFLLLGLRGALFGVVLAVLVLVLMSMATRASAAAALFIPGFTLTLGLVLTLLIVPVLTCLVTAVTARLAVVRALRATF
ncbi:MAG: hypothetical protein AAGK25_07490, partial [Pseudomonadota bacterium]